MGNAASREANYDRLEKVIPSLKNDRDVIIPNLKGAFADEADRKQFIHAILTVFQNNTPNGLGVSRYRLLFSRTENDRYMAQLLQQRPDGVLSAKIAPPHDSVDRAQAFLALKMEVERRLDAVLRNIPDVGSSPSEVRGEPQAPASASPEPGSALRAAGPSNETLIADGPESPQPLSTPIDAPPSYEDKDAPENLSRDRKR